jgi:acyl-CoA thioester hydrolase
MAPVHEHHLTVSGAAIDGNRHVNNVEYVRWMADAAKAHAQACGGTEVVKGLDAAWVVRSHWIEYLRPLLEGEKVVVRTWVENFRRVASLRQYRFLCGEKLVARGETKWVLIDLSTGRPRAIPPELAACFGVCPGGPEPDAA